MDYKKELELAKDYLDGKGFGDDVCREISQALLAMHKEMEGRSISYSISLNELQSELAELKKESVWYKECKLQFGIKYTDLQANLKAAEEVLRFYAEGREKGVISGVENNGLEFSHDVYLGKRARDYFASREKKE